MTPEQLIAEMQTIMGESYTVARSADNRPEPQFDVRPVPEQSDPDGNPYGVTFTVRSKDLASTPEDRQKLLAAYWASACDENIKMQIARGKAGKKVR